MPQYSQHAMVNCCKRGRILLVRNTPTRYYFVNPFHLLTKFISAESFSDRLWPNSKTRACQFLLVSHRADEVRCAFFCPRNDLAQQHLSGHVSPGPGSRQSSSMSERLQCNTISGVCDAIGHDSNPLIVPCLMTKTHVRGPCCLLSGLIQWANLRRP